MKMDKSKRIPAFAVMACAVLLPATAQENASKSTDDWKKITVSGSVMSDVLYQTDMDASGSSDRWATNTYANVDLMSKYVDAGARFSYLEHPLPGFEKDFKGWGFPYYYVKLHTENAALTLGHFYDQFGSGFIFRTYEERSLGVDNSICGARLALNPYKGINLKALTGKQRRYWKLNDSWVTGADLELGLDQWFKGMAEKNTALTLGASWINKHEKTEGILTDATHQLNLPENVNAFDVRANLHISNFSLLAEYAWKTQDPCFDNGYIYRKGNVAMLSASWSKSGISALVQAKRSDNMSFRSKRSVTGISSTLNHLPAFTMDHTYALAAIYPYATNPDGEWAYQAELGYRFKRGTALGGKYGTGVKVNFSHIRDIKRTAVDGGGMGTDGYSSSFFKWGDEIFYQDFNVQFDKKFSSSFKLNLMYMNQHYNKTVVEGHGGMVKSNIFVGDGQYRFSKDFTLRAELQYLSTKDDQGDWMYGLMELSMFRNWMFTVSDQYNNGDTKKHFYQVGATYNKNSHRVQLSYGRTREGYNCSGGVCRYVPETKGFALSYNYNF